MWRDIFPEKARGIYVKYSYRGRGGLKSYWQSIYVFWESIPNWLFLFQLCLCRVFCWIWLCLLPKSFLIISLSHSLKQHQKDIETNFSRRYQIEILNINAVIKTLPQVKAITPFHFFYYFNFNFYRQQILSPDNIHRDMPGKHACIIFSQTVQHQLCNCLFGFV